MLTFMHWLKSSTGSLKEDGKMPLKLYNTLSRKKEAFKPLKGKSVGYYTCGPTVYNFAHIGNFRAYSFQDLLKRYLRFKGFQVKHAMNITDVDDKTIRDSQKEGIPLKEFTQRYTRSFFEDIEKLRIENADIIVPATEVIPEIVELIKALLKKGLAYKSPDGSVYYNIKKFKPYGKLSKLKIKKLKAGARVSQDEYEKEQASDFALWKAWDLNDGNVFWETELGKGRPGWHVECSAISMKCLGESFDIHSGGVDLIFPHHENEIAQSQAATGKSFVKYWVHCGFLLVDGKKMAKSAGNFYTLRDLKLEEKGFRALRFLLLNSHYRQEQNFTFQALKDCENTIGKIDEFVEKVQDAGGKQDGKIASEILKAKKEVEKALDDDLNVPKAWSAFFGFLKKANSKLDKRKISAKNSQEIIAFLKELDSILPIFKFGFVQEIPEEVQRLAEERENARKAEDWKRADEIRSQILAKGYRVDDTQEGTRVKKAES